MNHENTDLNGKQSDAANLPSEAVAIGRRTFIGALLGMSTMFMAAVLGTPLLRIVLYSVYPRSTRKPWFNVGDLSDFTHAAGPVTKIVNFSQLDGWREIVSTQSVYVSRTPEGELQVLSAICPHLGCSVAWQAEQGKFVCPCHGGQFSADGRHLSGPPPRGLDCLNHRVKDGKVQVQFEYFRSNVAGQQSMS